MIARRFSNLKAIPLALYSRDLYQDVAHRWEGPGFSYLFLLLGVLAAPFTLAAALWFATFTLDKPYDFNYLIDQVPQIHVQNGEASSAAEQPYFIKTRENEVVGVVDMSRPVTGWPDELHSDKPLVAVGRKEWMFYNPSKAEKRVYAFSDAEDMVVDRELVRDLAGTLVSYAWVMPLFIVPFFVPFLFVYAILVMFAYGAIGLLFNLVLRTGYTYIDCVRLASVSTTASLLLYCLMLVVGSPLSSWTGFAIDMMYLFFAMWAAKQE